MVIYFQDIYKKNVLRQNQFYANHLTYLKNCNMRLFLFYFSLFKGG